MNRTETMYDIDYQRLGDYIREVNVRNRELRVTKPMGINIDKHFMPSVANIIGTDLSAYKLVYKNQFACNLMHVGRDEKIPMAMWNDANPIIVSPAYFVFEITKTEDLLPEYLMMWFRRAEFDRNAWFYTDADVRGGMNKDALLDMRLPIPTLARQREIVAEYETLTRRIRLNEQMIAKLEETAQALYRKMFVDGIDKENLLEGWRMSNLKSITEQTIGGDWGKEQPEGNYTHKVLCIRGADIPSINNCRHGFIPVRYILSKNLQSRKLFQGDIVVEISGGTPTQSTGRSAQMNAIADSYYGCDLICSNFCRVVRPVNPYADFYYATFTNLYRHDVFFKYENSTNGLKNLDLDAVLTEEKITIPSEMTVLYFSEQITIINNNIYYFGQELDKLTELQSLLLARMGKL